MTDTRTCRTELMDAACCASRSSAATSTAASGVADRKTGAGGAGGAARRNSDTMLSAGTSPSASLPTPQPAPDVRRAPAAPT